MGRLSEQDKVRAITLFKYSHWNQKMIAKELGCCRNTINTLITRWKKEGGDIKHVPKRKKGSGRPRLLTDQRLQEIVKHFEQNPSISVPQLKNILPELRHISDRTLQRNVKERLKLISRRVAKKPVLTEKMIQDRLLFCRRYRNWSANKWLKVLFTDESMFRVVNLGKQQNNTSFVRRPKGIRKQKLTSNKGFFPQLILTTGSQNRSPDIIVYYGIWARVSTKRAVALFSDVIHTS